MPWFGGAASRFVRGAAFLLPLLLLVPASGSAEDDAPSLRPLVLERDGVWAGNGVCYGMHRDGQRPGGIDPTREQIREDLRILVRHWDTLRTFGSSASPARDLLELIREEDLPLTVFLGVWIAPEETRDGTGAVTDSFPEARAANLREVAAGIELAREFEDLVAAVVVGNDTQVSWSGHRSPVDILLRHLHTVREAVSQPVTTADDYRYWILPESRDLAREVDFILFHAHPLGNGQRIDGALAWQEKILEDLRTLHPDRPLVLGETGWATDRLTTGEEGRIMQGVADEANQARYYPEVTAWARRIRLPLFWFEAFDENWKGGDDPREAEKHWGLYRADRTPKAVFADDGNR